ncbi:MAG: DNA repair protein RecN [Pedosphaera sp.]|nr:DNA repair protein RecN [Pedosphaera sp.]
MLTTLRIKNLALVDDLTLELRPGYSAITGETGAGKSIIIGALNLVLGERADRTLIRSGAEHCTVEASFDLTTLRAPLPEFLKENGLEPCEAGQLFLKRTFSASGTNRQFINGSPATLQVLSKIGEWLVDMHGPHDHQSLLDPAKQLAILDAFGGLEKIRDEFATIASRRSAMEAEKRSLIVDERTYAQQLDLLRFQVNEITSARLREDEEVEVGQEHQRASNSARLLELSQSALVALADDEHSLVALSSSMGRALHELQKLDAGADQMVQLHEQASAILRDLQAELAAYADKLDLDPARLRELEDRLNVIHSLKRKYGSTLADVVAFGEEARSKLTSLEQRDQELERIQLELAKLDSQLIDKGRDLSTRRRKLVPRLSKAVKEHLADLGFKQSLFEIALTSAPAGAKESTSGARDSSMTGFDSVEFQFAPNVGEPARALRAIASSGEMARVMLALKTALAAEDDVPVLIFDEVDANVGGETATNVGEKMRQIARQRQVLCITHLAPVAAVANAHYRVSKEIKSGRTISDIALLDHKQRVEELARMLGGHGDPALKHAESLLVVAEKK